jgi:prepilin-type processing-associated H-X9-DG protein
LHSIVARTILDRDAGGSRRYPEVEMEEEGMGTIGRRVRARSLQALATTLAVAFLAAVLLAGAALAAGEAGSARSAKPGKPAAKTPAGAIFTAMPTFSWSKVSGAAAYELRVFQGSKLLLKKTGIAKASWKSGKALPANVGLAWKVRARNARGTGAWSRSLKFEVTVPDQAHADSTADFVYWGGDITPMMHDNTYELVFTPSVIQAGTIAMHTMGYMNVPAGSGKRAAYVRLEMLAGGRVRFAINQYNGDGPGNGTWHAITSTAALKAGVRYHLAAEDGGGGMMLFVDGHLAAKDPYTGFPQTDWSDGTQWGGWFSAGDFEDFVAAETTAPGSYDEVRLSKVQRYSKGFVPPDKPFTTDADTLLLDHLDGSTSGITGGFTFGTP